MGPTAMTLLLCCAIVARNARILKAFEGRQADAEHRRHAGEDEEEPTHADGGPGARQVSALAALGSGHRVGRPQPRAFVTESGSG